MSLRTSRRRFLVAASAAASGIGFYSQLPAAESKSPNEKLNLAGIGVANRASANLSGCSGENFVALADIDSNFLEQGTKRFPGAKGYADYRVMLEKEEDNIDAVVVSTADHAHAPATAMALRMKKHAYCEKPLSHTVYESRVVSDLAKENKLATQMGTQIHATDNYRRVVELLNSGIIGDVTRVHVWVGKGWGDGKYSFGQEPPKSLNWDLFLGCAPERPYSTGVHPANWRRFWDYGTGTFGDMACHYVDLVHWALDLKHPEKVSAEGPEVDPVGCPMWCIADYQYPARGEKPPVHLTWYDGVKRPDELSKLKDKSGNPFNWGGGQLFVGDKGMVLSNYGQHFVFKDGELVDFEAPEQTIPGSIGHHNEWLQAIRTGGPTTCNFDYSGALSEAVLLGTVAYRSGDVVEWDAKNLKVTNNNSLAQDLIHKEYRKGWTL
ncbi:Gfo/Idh/MocA family protein [Blastopirellula retiformator]|uniref:Inositol 2-dehydrogenase n=1 Tax=Blastopirellula retiformator TaxID=2527970 RepID=A0A5C5V619_9BACT|nr:Gfo/Idh/MocA family oxidoreductase [Blastopirellula retiformator]TWT33393.1 Inositol 2-dehydrogenase [Blastopirellula retiformator]